MERDNLDDLFILLQSKLNVEASALTISRQLKDLESKLKEININLKIGNIDSQLQGMFENMVKEAEKAKEKTEKVFKELKFDFKDSKQMNGLLGTLNFDDFKAKIDKVKASVNELNSIKVRVGADNKIDSAVLNYTNSIGQAVTETLAWADVTDKSGEVIGKTWKTIDTVFDDNIKKTRDMIEAIERYKESMSSKLDKMELTKDIDPLKMQELRDGLNGISINADDVSNAMKNLSSAYQNTNRESQTKNQALTKESESYKKLSFDLKEFQKIQSNKISMLGNTDADTKKVADLQNRLKGLTIDTPNLKNEMKSLANDISILGSQSEKAGSSFGLLTKYFSAYQVFSIAKRAIESLVGQVYELDKALIELKKTTSMSDTELTSFSKYAYEESSLLGRSGVDFTKAVADFRRGGYDLQDSITMARNSLLTLNIGDGINSVEQSSKGLISVTKALKISAEDSISVLDKVNNVANNTSISFDALYEILTKSTGVLSQTGSDLNQIIAMSNAGFSTLRDASVVSTGLNSISVRLLAVKEGAKEADGEIVSKLEPTLKRIAGVKIMDENGLRNMYDILSDLAKVYPTLNREQQQLVASEIGGRQQIKTITSLLQNWEEAERALAFSLNSTGSAMEEQSNFAQGLEYKLTNMKTAWSSLAQTTINSNFIKGIVDATTYVIKLVDKLGGLVPVLITVGGAIAAVKFQNIVFDLMSLIPLLNKATLAFAGLNSVAMFSWAGVAIAGVVGVTMAISDMSKSAERAYEKVSDLKSELNDLQSNSQNITDLSYQYEQLSNLEKQQSLTNEQQKEFTRIQNELKGLLPEVSGYYDTQGNFIIAEKVAMEDLVAIQKEYIEEKRKEYALAAAESGNHTIKSYDKEVKEINDLNDGLEILYSMVEDSPHLQLSIDEQEKAVKELGETHKVTVGKMQEEISAILAVTDDWTKLTNEQKDAISKYMAEQDEKKLRTWREELLSGGEAANNFTKYLLKAPTVIEYVENATKKASSAVGELGDKFEHTQEEIDVLAKTFSDSSSEIQTLTKAVEELDKYHELSSKTINSLVDKYPELITLLGDEQETRKFLTGQIQDQESIHKKVVFEMIQYDTDYFNNKIKGNEHLANEIKKLYGVDLSNFNNLAEAKAEVEQKLINAIGNAWAKLYNSNYDAFQKQLGVFEGQVADGDIHAEKQLSRMYDAAKAVKSIKDAAEFDKVVVDFVGAGSTPYNNKPSAAKEKKSSSDSKIQGYNEEKRLLDAINESLQAQDNIITSLEAKKKRAQEEGHLQTELSLHKQIISEQEKKANLYESQQIALSNLRQKMINDSKKQFGVDISTMTNSELEAKFNQLYAGKTTKTSKEQSDNFKQMMNNWNSLNDMDFKLSNDVENVHATLKNLVDTKWDIEVNIRDNNPQVIANKEITKNIEREMQLISGNSVESDQKRLEKQRELVGALLSEKELAQRNIDYYKEQLSLVSQSSSEYTKINSLLDQSNDKLHDTNVKLMESNRQLSDYIRKELQRGVESSIYGRRGRDSWEDSSNARINSLRDELEALREIDEVQKEREDREKRLLEIEKLREKLANLKTNKTVQQLTKDKDGRWQWEYVSDAVAIDKTQKELYDKEQDHLKKEEELDKKYKIKDIERQIKHEEEQAKIRRESYDRMIRDLDATMERQSSIFEMSGEDVFDIVSNSLDGLRGLYNGKFDDIIDDIQRKMGGLSGLFGGLMSGGNYGGSSSGGGGSSSSGYDQEFIGETGKKYQIHSSGTIVVTRPDGTQSAVAPWDSNYSVTQDAMNKDKPKSTSSSNGSNGSSGGGNSSNDKSSSSGGNPIKNVVDKIKDIFGNIKDTIGFADGGETDMTGFHLLHGKKGEPERVLSAEQTKAFSILVKNMPEFNSVVNNMLKNSPFALNVKETVNGFSAASSMILAKDKNDETAVHNYYDKLVFPNVKDGNDIIDTFKNLAFLADKI